MCMSRIGKPIESESRLVDVWLPGSGAGGGRGWGVNADAYRFLSGVMRMLRLRWR